MIGSDFSLFSLKLVFRGVYLTYELSVSPPRMVGFCQAKRKSPGQLDLLFSSDKSRNGTLAATLRTANLRSRFFWGRGGDGNASR